MVLSLDSLYLISFSITLLPANRLRRTFVHLSIYCLLIRFVLVGVSVPKKPLAPININSTSSTISLQWYASDKSGLPTTYTIHWNPASVSGIANKSGINETSTTITDLQSNTAYHFTVSAVSTAGSSKVSGRQKMITGWSL